MTLATGEWEGRLNRLVDELVATGKLRSPEWIDAFRTVPRHVLVPQYYQQDATGQWSPVATDHGPGLDAVYTNKVLFTDVDERGHGVSSSSMPSLMARMVEMLDIRDGHRVLEIGTGTGYHAALLSRRLGSENVYSLDIDYVDIARERLATLGYRPTLVTRDGRDGMPEHAPFDRIMSTVAVSAVPRAWVEQVHDDGLILADVRRGISAGNLALLRRRGEVAEGRFDSGYAQFMGMRRLGEPPLLPAQPVQDDTATECTTSLPAFAWERPIPWFLASVGLPVDIVVGKRFDESGRDSAALLFGSDGSWVSVSLDVDRSGRRTVTQAGPTRLWEAVERGYRQWEAAGCPGWSRLGLTVAADGVNTVWLDQPGSDDSWQLVP